MDRPHLNFLLNAVNSLTSPSQFIIKNHLLHEGHIIAKNQGFSLPGQFRKKSKCCEHCQSLWCDGKYSISVSPQIKPGRKMRKILNKQEKYKLLNKVEDSLIRRVHDGNTLKFKCHVCKKSTNFLINKPAKEQPSAKETETPIKEKRKKKRKKDKFAGLTPSAVAAATPTAPDFISLSTNTKITNTIDSTPKITPLGATPTDTPARNPKVNSKTIVKPSVSARCGSFFSKLSPSGGIIKKKIKEKEPLLNPYAVKNIPDSSSSKKNKQRTKLIEKLNKKKEKPKSLLKDFLSLL